MLAARPPEIRPARRALFLTVLLSLAAPLAANAQAGDVEPAALDMLRRSLDYVGSLERFSLETENTLEEVLESEQKIQRDFTARVLVQRPNRLRVERGGDLLDQTVVYDGEMLAIHDRMRGYYAMTEAPDDLDGLLHFARDTLQIVPPSSDIVYSNAFERLSLGLESGFLVGKSMVDGVRCDHLAFRNPAVDWQIWVSEGAEPLPRKMVVTTRGDSAKPQYVVLMRDWNTAPKVKKNTFVFTAPKDGQEIEFLRMDAGQPATR